MKPIDQLTDDELMHRLREATALADAPSTLIRRAIELNIDSGAATLLGTARAALRTALATLAFDSWSGGTLSYGVRGASTDVRHLLFSALGRDVDIRVSAVDDGFSVAGQVLGPDETGSVELERVSADSAGSLLPRMVVELDSMGQFRIDSIEGGAWIVRFRLGDDEVELPPIELGEQRA